MADEIAAVTSPSWISLMRAPVSRISSIRIVVAVAIEHDRRDVHRLAAEGLGDREDVLSDRREQVDVAARDVTDGQLAHVHRRHREHAAGSSPRAR